MPPGEATLQTNVVKCVTSSQLANLAVQTEFKLALILKWTLRNAATYCKLVFACKPHMRNEAAFVIRILLKTCGGA